MQRGIKRGGPGLIDTDIAVHINKAPPQAIVFPRDEKVNVQFVLNHYQENPDYYTDGIRVVPGSTNIGTSLSFGSTPYGNSMLKGRRQKVYPKEPGFNPAGGVRYDLSFLQVPEEYYDLLRLRRPDTSIDPVQQATIGLDVPRPQMIPTKLNDKRTDKTIMPSVVYDHFKAMPELGNPNRLNEDRPSTYVMNVSSENSHWDRMAPGSVNTMTKFVAPKDLISNLTPIFSTVLKMGDVSVPIKLKDPMAIALQAQTQGPIDVPIPNIGNVRLKDYTWIITQANTTVPAVLTLDITPSLKERPDLSHMLEPLISSGFVDTCQRELKTIDYRRDPIAFETPISNPWKVLNQNEPSMQQRQSKPYSNWDGDYTLIPEAGQLMEFGVSFSRKPKIVPEPNQNTLVSNPWVNYR